MDPTEQLIKTQQDMIELQKAYYADMYKFANQAMQLLLNNREDPLPQPGPITEETFQEQLEALRDPALDGGVVS